MGKIIAIEGIDGSGKNTQSNKILQGFLDNGFKCEKMSFPRYGETFFGREVGRYLNGEFGSLESISPKLSAMLYAGDRHESRDDILSKIAGNGILICDRYVYSNVAHQSAKLSTEARDEISQWIEELEFKIYKLPKPDLTIFLDVPPEVSGNLILKKELRDYTDKKKDLHEEDESYLEKVYHVFKKLACETPDWIIIDCFENGLLLGENEIYEKIRTELIKRDFYS
ncbi:dTMP kinase [Pseudomonas sp. H3_C08]